MPEAWTTVIEPGRSERHYWRDIWRFRELLAFLAWRDILVRYKQAVLGIAWSVLRPFLTMVVFAIVFGKLAGMHATGDVPYPVLIFAGLLPWQFFSNAFSESSMSLISNTNLLTKVYFPRMILPATSLVVSLVDFAIAFVILLVMMVWYRFLPGWHMMALPALLLLALVISLGAGLFVAALNVKYRDFRYVVPFIVQIGLYLSPVGFSSSIVPGKWRLLYSLNPMVGVIDGFRWAILGNERLYPPAFLTSLAVTAVMLGFGIWYFRKTERTFADIV